MDAITAFQDEKQKLMDALSGAQNLSQAITAVEMTLERVAAAMARADGDEESRQRAQIVLALAKRSPLFLRAARANGRILMEDAQEPKKNSKVQIMRWIALALILIPAAYELLSRRILLGLIGVAGIVLLLLGKTEEQQLPAVHAEGVLSFDPKELIRETEDLCRAADAAMLDLQLLTKEAGQRQSGAQEEALLDLAASLLEAQAIEGTDLTPETEQLLRRLGIETVEYTAGDSRFEVLPTKGSTRTVRPAMMRAGKLLRRGVAAVQVREEQA